MQRLAKSFITASRVPALRATVDTLRSNGSSDNPIVASGAGSAYTIRWLADIQPCLLNVELTGVDLNSTLRYRSQSPRPAGIASLQVFFHGDAFSAIFPGS